MTHNFDKAEFDSRRQAKITLAEPHTPPTSVPGLRSRGDLVEPLIECGAGK